MEPDAAGIDVVPGTLEQPERRSAHETNKIELAMRTECSPLFGHLARLKAVFQVLHSLYVVPFGISLGELRLFVMARKMAVNFVMFWLLGALAWQPAPSSE